MPEELYEEIAANDRQREEWVRLFAINEITGDMATRGYSEPLEVEFLRANPCLVVDTSLFDSAFTECLLASIEDLDQSMDGLLLQSDNFQALILLRERYSARVGCAYIDPPYNTELDRTQGNFLYKDSYEHASWLAMMYDRLRAIRPLLAQDGTFFSSIDDNEVQNLRHVADSLFGIANFIGVIVWKSRDSVSSDHLISMNHNYHVAYAANREESAFGGFRINEGDYSNPDADPRGPWKPVPLDANKPGGDTQYEITNPNTGVSYPPPKGRSWAINRQEYERLFDDKRIVFGKTGKAAPKRKMFLRERLDRGDVATPLSVWADTETTQTGTDQVEAMFGDKVFSYPKPVGVLPDLIQIGHRESDATVLDYFAGSGTTAHAVINLNREDGGQRKFILVEMGEYFDTVMKPRVLKAVYSKDWKGGKPVSREGVSQLIKVIRLESYEDALNNLDVRRTEQQQSLLDAHDGLHKEYMLRYWLGVETRGSASLLDIERFDDPRSYTLKIARGSAAETRLVTVDLVETFNYLIGLRVRHVDVIRGVTMVQGTLPSGEKALVIWRKVADMPSEELDRFLFSQSINPRDMEFDVIYVNGDNHLENTRRPDKTWEVRLIEEEFLSLMFETADRA